MNASATHLDLEDLIAEVTGQDLGSQAREHLAGCGPCQLEAERWRLVAGGVRDLAAGAAEVPQPARLLRTGGQARAVPWRRALAVAGSAAAALVLLLAVGIAAGLVHVHVTRPGSGAALTSVSGCARLEQAGGTLKRVHGADVVIKTASGQLVTVTTTATTELAASGALLGDITDGAAVVVAGTGSGGRIAADYVVVGGHPSLTVPGIATVRGHVSDAAATGFTVATSASTRVRVTTSGATVVTLFHASPRQLQGAGRTIAIGSAGPDGTLTALAVVQPPSWPAGAHAALSVRNCSPGAINREIMALAAGGCAGPAGLAGARVGASTTGSLPGVRGLRWRVAGLAVPAALLSAGCSSGPAGAQHVTLAAGPAAAAFDGPWQIKLSGLPPGGTVAVRAQARDDRGRRWESRRYSGPRRRER